MDPEDMPVVNFKKEKKVFTTSQKHWIQKVSNYNIGRVSQFAKERRRANLIGCGLGAGVIAIYLYTMHAVQQETFLDDFEIPETYQAAQP